MSSEFDTWSHKEQTSKCQEWNILACETRIIWISSPCSTCSTASTVSSDFSQPLSRRSRCTPRSRKSSAPGVEQCNLDRTNASQNGHKLELRGNLHVVEVCFLLVPGFLLARVQHKDKATCASTLCLVLATEAEAVLSGSIVDRRNQWPQC